MPSMTSLQILLKAADLYEASPSHAALDEWPEPGTFCVITALGAIESGTHAAVNAFTALYDRALQDGEYGLVSWNAKNSTAYIANAMREIAENLA